MRLFFSVPLPGEAQDRAAAALAEMRRAAPALSWTRPDQLHFTLAFLGEQDDDALERLVAAAEATRVLPAFDATLSGAGAFPNPRRPRVLWLGVGEGAPQLEAVAEKLQAALRPAGFELEERPFRPHLTVARVKPGAERGAQRALDLAPKGEVARFPVGELHLVRSHLGKGGARHETLRTFPFTAGC
jgi:2'-5' RNA ligase